MIEYIFGKRFYNGKEEQYVKTASDTEHTDFPEGKYVTYRYQNDITSITYTFRVLWKYHQDIDLQGKYQDWYYIDNVSKEVDDLIPIRRSLEEQSSQLLDQSAIIDDILIELLKE